MGVQTASHRNDVVIKYFYIATDSHQSKLQTATESRLSICRIIVLNGQKHCNHLNKSFNLVISNQIMERTKRIHG